jgi:hypothetical protein
MVISATKNAIDTVVKQIIKEGHHKDCGFNRLKKKVLMQEVRAEVLPDINASSNDKNILDEFDDTNTFANMENYGSYSKNVMKHEAA